MHKAAEGSCLSAMQTGRIKTSEDLDNIYNKISAHTWIEEEFTSDEVVIPRATRDLSWNIITRTVAYGALKTSLASPRSRTDENQIVNYNY